MSLTRIDSWFFEYVTWVLGTNAVHFSVCLGDRDSRVRLTAQVAVFCLASLIPTYTQSGVNYKLEDMVDTSKHLKDMYLLLLFELNF